MAAAAMAAAAPRAGAEAGAEAATEYAMDVVDGSSTMAPSTGMPEAWAPLPPRQRGGRRPRGLSVEMR